MMSVSRSHTVTGPKPHEALQAFGGRVDRWLNIGSSTSYAFVSRPFCVASCFSTRWSEKFTEKQQQQQLNKGFAFVYVGVVL